MCGREVWFDAQRRWQPSVGLVRCRAERGSIGGEPVQRRVAGACWWDFEKASARRAWVCPFTGAACARMCGAGGTACVYVGGSRTWDVTRLGDRLDIFLHPGSVRSYVSDCVMCEAAYADSILLLLHEASDQDTPRAGCRAIKVRLKCF